MCCNDFTAVCEVIAKRTRARDGTRSAYCRPGWSRYTARSDILFLFVSPERLFIIQCKRMFGASVEQNLGEHGAITGSRRAAWSRVGGVHTRRHTLLLGRSARSSLTNQNIHDITSQPVNGFSGVANQKKKKKNL